MMYEQTYGYDMGMTKPTMSWGGEAGGFTMDNMYRPTAQTGMPKTMATSGTAPQPTTYTPKKGVWQDFGLGYMGDGPVPQDWKSPGQWNADPNVDYGTSPGANFGQMFDKEGNFIGWQEKGLLSAGGSGLFGSFGDTKSLQQYLIDPATGTWKDPSQISVTPSKSSGTNIMSYAMPIAMMAGLGAGAAGGAFSGAGAELGMGMGAAPGEAAGAFSGSALGGAEVGAGAGGLVELGGGGAGYTGSVPGITSTTALPGSGAGTLGGGSFTELLTKYGPKVLGALTQMGGGGGEGGKPGQGGGAGGMGILDLLGAYYSSQQMKDMSGNLKGIYSDLTNRQDQFRNQLLKSYEDPNQFYGSNQWKGLESVYQNSIDRGAAKGGTLANPTDRERLLQSYAMKELENYREGLRQSAGMTRPESALGPLAEGMKAEAYANTAPFASAARGGTGANISQTWDTIKNTASTAEDVWKFISSWFD